jgi:hypothetical protein
MILVERLLLIVDCRIIEAFFLVADFLLFSQFQRCIKLSVWKKKQKNNPQNTTSICMMNEFISTAIILICCGLKVIS